MVVDVLQDLRSLFGAIRHQGERPTCVAFAVSDAHRAARGSPTTLSVEHLYYHAVQRTPGRDPEAGVALATILEALRLDGQCAEMGWGYLDALPPDLKTWRPPASATRAFRRDATWVGANVASILTQLDAGAPAVVTLLLGQRFYEPVDGVVTTGPNDPDTDYHAIVAIGHGLIATQPFVLVRNSWGDDWGLHGQAWIAADYLEPRLVGAAIISKAETV